MQENNKGWKPIDIAAKNGEQSIIDALFNHINCINDSENLLSNSLYYAIKNNNDELIKDLCDNQDISQVIKQKDNDGNTLLHHAIQNNRVEAVKLLLEKGADPMQENNKGWKPIDLVAKAGDHSMIDALLTQIQMPNKDESVHKLKSKEQNLTQRLLYNSLYYAIHDNNYELIQILCNNHDISQMINIQSSTSETLLDHAKNMNNEQIVKLLSDIANHQNDHSTITDEKYKTINTWRNNVIDPTQRKISKNQSNIITSSVASSELYITSDDEQEAAKDGTTQASAVIQPATHPRKGVKQNGKTTKPQRNSPCNSHLKNGKNGSEPCSVRSQVSNAQESRLNGNARHGTQV